MDIFLGKRTNFIKVNSKKKKKKKDVIAYISQARCTFFFKKKDVITYIASKHIFLN